MLKKFGADLKNKRKARHHSTRYCQQDADTRHASRENGARRFFFYSSTYIRAFLKQYSKITGLNPDEVLFNYEMARSGKYSGMQEASDDEEIKTKEVNPESHKAEPVPETSDKSKLDDIFEVPPVKRHTITSNLSEPDKNESEESYPEKKAFSKSKRIKIEGDRGEFNGKYYEDKGFKMPVAFLKNLGIVLLILALLFGIYLLVDVVFLSGKGTKTEIIRQNFDDIVKETEKKCLEKERKKRYKIL